MNRLKNNDIWYLLLTIIYVVAILFGQAFGQQNSSASLNTHRVITAELRAAAASLNMPGVNINLDQWCVDMDAKVALEEGLLELVACTVNSKEHESIVAVVGKPSFAHTALLLLGAKPGKPASFEWSGDENQSGKYTLPSGGLVDVYLVFNDVNGKEGEYPINEFIIRAVRKGAIHSADHPTPKIYFPTHTFIFAGSILEGDGNGPFTYLSDVNGNVISITTFTDELLCLPEISEHTNDSLLWEVDSEKLPPIDSHVILRLRPH